MEYRETRRGVFKNIIPYIHVRIFHGILKNIKEPIAQCSNPIQEKHQSKIP